MIRDAREAGGRARTSARQDRSHGGVLAALESSSVADRFCAWKGRSERRSIFSVFPLCPDTGLDDLPLDAGGVILGVRRDTEGCRRVLWAAAVAGGRAPESLAAAVAALGARGEVHLHLLAVGDMAREAILADLGFPRLAVGRAAPAVQTVATSLGASMNPPDCRRQRSA